MSVLGYHDSDDDDEDGILYSVRLLEMDPEVSLRREALAELRAQDELPPDFPSDEHLELYTRRKMGLALLTTKVEEEAMGGGSEKVEVLLCFRLSG